TGSSSGIGAAIARRFAGLGAGVVVNSASSAEAGRRVAAEIGDAVYVQGDVGDPPLRPPWSRPPSSGGGGSMGWETTPGSPWTCRCLTSTASGSITGRRPDKWPRGTGKINETAIRKAALMPAAQTSMMRRTMDGQADALAAILDDVAPAAAVAERLRGR